MNQNKNVLFKTQRHIMNQNKNVLFKTQRHIMNQNKNVLFKTQRHIMNQNKNCAEQINDIQQSKKHSNLKPPKVGIQNLFS